MGVDCFTHLLTEKLMVGKPSKKSGFCPPLKKIPRVFGSRQVVINPGMIAWLRFYTYLTCIQYEELFISENIIILMEELENMFIINTQQLNKNILQEQKHDEQKQNVIAFPSQAKPCIDVHCKKLILLI